MKVADLRDALAHGRLSSQVAAPPMRLAKYGEPKNGMCELQFSEIMDLPWLKKNINFVFNQCQKAFKALKLIDPNVKP